MDRTEVKKGSLPEASQGQDRSTFYRENLEKVMDFTMPVNQKHLKSFLGMCGYYRTHILHYSELTHL